jgi:excisionase family DNA binding protein
VLTDLLTVAEVAERYRFSVPMVYVLLNERRFEHVRVGRLLRISASAFEAWLATQVVQPVGAMPRQSVRPVGTASARPARQAVRA